MLGHPGSQGANRRCKHVSATQILSLLFRDCSVVSSHTVENSTVGSVLRSSEPRHGLAQRVGMTGVVVLTCLGSVENSFAHGCRSFIQCILKWLIESALTATDAWWSFVSEASEDCDSVAIVACRAFAVVPVCFMVIQVRPAHRRVALCMRLVRARKTWRASTCARTRKVFHPGEHLKFGLDLLHAQLVGYSA